MSRKSRLCSSAPTSRTQHEKDRLSAAHVENITKAKKTAKDGNGSNTSRTTTSQAKKRTNFDTIQCGVNLGLTRLHGLRSEDDPELSMLRSIAEASTESWAITSTRLERLREHEYEDHSDSEQTPDSKERNALVKKPRALSAGARSSYVRDMESRLVGLRHEKMRTSRSREVRDDRLNGLIYDPDFDCYYNPITDQYYRLQPDS